MNLIRLFTNNLTTPQKQYEAVRAIAFNEGTFHEIAERFDYTIQSLKTLLSRVKNGQHRIFPEVKKGPKKRRTPPDLIKLILTMRRKEKMSSSDIVWKLREQSVHIGIRTVERILAEAGFPRLRRRTFEERGLSKKGMILPERSAHIDFEKLKPFHVDCKVAGVYFFLPWNVFGAVPEEKP
ncbi:hypothetical protein KJ996_06685 [Patescibacteria group bacterium]|nr:hypothetical protein [Patescibacteria group bacterium]